MGEELREGEHLVSPDEQFHLTLKSDGHLAIYRKDKPNEPVWKSTFMSTESNIEGPFTFRMQKDNNAVVYDRKEQPLWNVSTYDPEYPGRFHLEMDNDGNFYLRDQNNEVEWTSHTAMRRFDDEKEGMPVLDRGEELRTGQYLVSPNEQVCLAMQPDGYLAIYKKDNPGSPIWKSTINSAVTNIVGPFTFKLREDNDAVVYDGHERSIWHTDTAHNVV